MAAACVLPASTVLDFNKSSDCLWWADQSDVDIVGPPVDGEATPSRTRLRTDSHFGMTRTPQSIPPPMAGLQQARVGQKSTCRGGSKHGQQNRQSAGRADGAKEATTICFRNLPNNYTTQMVLDLLDAKGFKNYYDFIYLPHDFKRLPQRVNVGYFFINFVTKDVAARAWNEFSGFDNWTTFSHKVLTPSWATKTQGLSACIARYWKSHVMHQNIPAECKPMLVESGKLVPLRSPSKPTVSDTSADSSSDISSNASPVESIALECYRLNETVANNHPQNFCQSTASQAVAYVVGEQTSLDEPAQKILQNLNPTLLVKNTFIDVGRSPSVERLRFRAVKSFHL